MSVVVEGLGEDNIAQTEKIAPTSWKYHQVIEL
jgi:hypothetical protein